MAFKHEFNCNHTNSWIEMTHIFIFKYMYNCHVGLTPQNFLISCQSKTLFYYSAKWSNISHVWVCLHYTCNRVGTSSYKTTGFVHRYGAFISYLVGWLVEGIFVSCVLNHITVAEEYPWSLILFVTILSNGVLSTARGNIASTNNVHSLNLPKSWYSPKSSFLALTGECNIEE